MTRPTATVHKAYYPWLVWALAAMFFFYKYLVQLSPSVMTSELMSAFQITGTGLGNLAACYFYAYLLMQIPVGLLLDRYPPRKITALAIFICAISTILFGMAHNVYMAGLWRFCMGLGAAFAPVACLKLASVWFPPRRFALLAGLSMTVAMLGAVNGGAPLSELVLHFGWRQALMLVGIPGIILAIVFLGLVKDHKPNPQDHTPALGFKGLGKVLCNKQTWYLSFYSGFAFAPFSVLGGLWGVPFLQAVYGLSKPAAAAKISLMFVGFAIGCPLFGGLSDYIGRRRSVMAYGTVAALVALCAVIYVPMSGQWLNACLFIFGLGIGAFLLCFSMIREINNIMLAATAIGFMNSFDSFWEAVSEPIIGKLLDMHWLGQMENGARIFSVHTYKMALLILPIYMLIALLILFWVKETHGRQTRS